MGVERESINKHLIRKTYENRPCIYQRLQEPSRSQDEFISLLIIVA